MDSLPWTGEETWIRRGMLCSGEFSFILREAVVLGYVLLAVGVGALPALFLVFLVVLEAVIGVPGGAWFTSALPMAMLGVVFAPIAIAVLRVSRFCPLWLFAEKINPEAVEVLGLRSCSKVQLSNCRVETRRVCRMFFTVRLACKNTNVVICLPLLTESEHARVMRYVNQAGRMMK